MNDAERVRSAAMALTLAHRRRDQMIMEAREHGMSWQSIADAAGLTKQGVIKLGQRYTTDRSRS